MPREPGVLAVGDCVEVAFMRLKGIVATEEWVPALVRYTWPWMVSVSPLRGGTFPGGGELLALHMADRGTAWR